MAYAEKRELKPFQVHIDPRELDDLRRRLGRARWAHVSPDDGWAYGTRVSELRSLVHRRRDAIKHSAVTLDDRVGWFGPGERRGILVPTPHVGGEMLAKSFLRVKVGLTERLLAQDAEEALHLVQP